MWSRTWDLGPGAPISWSPGDLGQVLELTALFQVSYTEQAIPEKHEPGCLTTSPVPSLFKNKAKKLPIFCLTPLAPGSQTPGSVVTLSFESHDADWSLGVGVPQCGSELVK